MFARGPSERLIVFARCPEPGTTKTRLIPCLGPAGAAELQRRMTQRVLTACERCGVDLEIRFAGTDPGDMAGAHPMTHCRPQAAGSLGRRMEAAFAQAFTEGASRVVIVGADCPELTTATLRRALDTLREHAAVLAPARDGGYVLIGLRAPCPALFPEDMPWGTAAVAERTRVIAVREGLDLQVLAEQDDVDVPEDLLRLRGTDLVAGLLPELSVIIPALNEGAVIAATITAARAEGVEVLVADGGSTDETVARAAAAGARVLHAPPGRGPQMNAGAAGALAETLLFLHADTRLPPDYRRAVRDTLARPDTAAGAFELGIADANRALRRVARWANRRSRWLGLPYGDQALFLRREVFAAVGGFPDQPILEDVALLRRLRRVGRIRLAPAAVTTSARRWQQRGVLRTTLINQLMLLGYQLGVRPKRLARFYRGTKGPK